MFILRLTPQAGKDFSRLPPEIQKRLDKKLKENAALDNPLARAEALVNLPPSTHRFRVGKYRVSFYIDGKTLFIERIGLRDKAYERH